MKFIKLDLLTLLISLFLFASCENTATIGLEIDPSIAVQGALVDTLTISSRTQQDDVPTSLSASRYPVGYLKDAIFGTTESNISLVVNLPYAAYSFGTNPVLDSAVLVLNYGGEFYGDSTQNYSFEVHQLSKNLARETSFPANKTYAYEPFLLGTKSGKIYPNTPYKVTDIVVGKADTMRVATPQVRIKLNNGFIQSTIVNASTTDLATNAAFNALFNGLHVQLNKAASTGIGGLAFFEFANSKSELSLYYKKDNTTTGLKDTVNISFPITSSSSPIGTTIKHDYTGTPVATQLANPTTQYPVTYLQPLGGLRNKISFPYLTNFAANIGKVVINKAELVIDMSTGTDIIPYNAAPRLSLYRYDIAERRQNLPDNNLSTQYTQGDPRAFSPTVFGGYFNATTKQYVFVVTSYIQDLIDGKIKDYGTFLAPTPLSAFEVYGSVSTGARVVVGAYKKTPAVGDNVMKLNIYYTKIN